MRQPVSRSGSVLALTEEHYKHQTETVDRRQQRTEQTAEPQPGANAVDLIGLQVESDPY